MLSFTLWSVNIYYFLVVFAYAPLAIYFLRNVRATRTAKTVLLLVESGLTNNDISEKLFIAPGTVRAHIGRIYKKLDVHSREELDALVKG